MKKVFIGFLAALMLFAFTACENRGSNLSMIYSVNATAGDTVYLPGETVDPTEFEYEIVYTDGSVGNATATDFQWINTVVENSSNTDGTYTVTGYYKGNANWTVTPKVNVGTVTEISVNDDNLADTPLYATSTAEDKYRDDTIDPSGLVITVKYTFKNEEGTKEISVDNKFVDYSIVAEAWAEAEATEVTVVYPYYSASSTQPSGTYKVTLLENLVSSVELKATDGYKVYRNGKNAGSDALKYAASTSGKLDDDAVGIYLEASYLNGEKKVVAENDVLFPNSNGQLTADDLDNVVIGDGDSVKIAVAYNGSEGTTTLVAEAEEINVPVENEQLIGFKFFNTSDSNKEITLDKLESKILDHTKDKENNATFFNGNVAVVPVFASYGYAATEYGASSVLAYNGDNYPSYTVSGDINFTNDEVYEANQRVTVTVSGNVDATYSYSGDYTVLLVE